MGNTRRESALTKSIQSGLLREPDKCKKTPWGRFLAFFTVRRIKFVRHELELFARLRKEIWNFDEYEYQASFRTTSGQPPLKMMGDLGYSGSVSSPRYNCKEIILTSHDGRHSSAVSMATSSSRASLVVSSIPFSRQSSSSHTIITCETIQTRSWYGSQTIFSLPM